MYAFRQAVLCGPSTIPTLWAPLRSDSIWGALMWRRRSLGDTQLGREVVLPIPSGDRWTHARPGLYSLCGLAYLSQNVLVGLALPPPRMMTRFVPLKPPHGEPYDMALHSTA